MRLITLLNVLGFVNSFDYYILAVQNWCSKDKYMIHGLWPDYYNGSYPTNCDGPDYIQIPNLEDKLNKYWYDCNDNESRQLWIHEWDKHGKCVYEQEKLSQEEYFNKAIELFLEYPPDKESCFDLNFNKIGCIKHSYDDRF